VGAHRVREEADVFESWVQALTAVAALGCGLVGGVFFAFSTFVLRGLPRLPAEAGIAAMRSINITAVRPAFMTALFGTGAICLVLGVGAVTSWGEPATALLVTGSGLYLGGNVAVTVGANVPLNDDLAAVDPHGDGAAARWEAYVRRWSQWNHVRTVTALLASALFLAALTS
jgi:uncharacterized membrane protein